MIERPSFQFVCVTPKGVCPVCEQRPIDSGCTADECHAPEKAQERERLLGWFADQGVSCVYSVILEGVPRTKNQYPMNRRGIRYNAHKELQLSMGREMSVQYTAASIEMPLALSVVFYRPDRRRFDADNAKKLLGDAGTGILWTDDSLITDEWILIRVDKGRPRTHLHFGAITGNLPD